MATNSVQRFPTKEELIKRFMHEFQLYHQFEFEDQLRQNDDMKFEDFDTLFRAGRAFKANFETMTKKENDYTYGDIYDNEEGSDSENETPIKPKTPEIKKKDTSSMSTWSIVVNLEVEENHLYKQYYELEEIAPAAKEKSPVCFLMRKFSTKDGLYENEVMLSRATIIKRDVSTIELIVTDSNKNINKMINSYQNDSAFFGCYNEMTTRKRVAELNSLMSKLLEKRVLMSQVIEYLSGRVPIPLEARRYDENLVEPQIANLNPSQQDSIRNYLNCESFYLTIGPPGTGKSEVICKFLELCHQLDYRVLVCSMSHAAVDNVLLRFAGSAYYQRWKQANPAKSFVARCGVEQFID